MRTMSEVVEYLVAQGKPLAHAKVAVHEGYNFADDNDTSDLCLDSEQCQIEVTGAMALSMYSDMCGPNGYFEVTNDGFVFEGDEEVKFDLNGDLL